jgi:hypothetical protein
LRSPNSALRAADGIWRPSIRCCPCPGTVDKSNEGLERSRTRSISSRRRVRSGRTNTFDDLRKDGETNMMTTRLLRFCGTVPTRGDASRHLKASGDAVLVERGRPRLLLLSCPCGCGEEFPINLDPRSGPAWRLYRSDKNGLSLFPSVWRESGCRSHYIIWRDKILLFGQNEEEFDSTPPVDEITKLVDTVYEQLPYTSLIAFADIADTLNSVPWDVLIACRRLVRSGRAREGTDSLRGYFGRVR